MTSPAYRVWTVVERAIAPASTPPVLGWHLDSPAAGSRHPGHGLELNGWLVGDQDQFLGVRTVTGGEVGPIHELNVPRPDVFADYPAPHAACSGFSFWQPLPAGNGWRIELYAVTRDQQHVPLQALEGSIISDDVFPAQGQRAVQAPDFVIVGTQRGGTTSLHAYLNQHPQISTPAKKELHYLTDRYDRGHDWYLGQFPATVAQGTLVGEATPYALFHPLAPGRLRLISPTTRVIALLRNPVDRAYSHYLLERSRGHECLTFMEALDAEPDRLANLEHKLGSGELRVSDVHKRASYMARGEYARQWLRYVPAPGHPEPLYLRSEDLYRDPQGTVRTVTDFLDLPPLTGVDYRVHNATSGPPLPPDARERLRAHFAPLNATLAGRLGWDPDWN
ncbi:MAG: sulfotransferase domain-containing protein [Thermomicrobiales bacterium]